MNRNLAKTKCFIESQAGSPYAIRFRISPLLLFPDDTDVLIVSVFVDGKPFDEKCISRKKLCGEDYIDEISYCQRDLPDGSTESYTLAFEDLTLMEGAGRETVNPGLQRVKALGTIQIAVQVAKRVASCPAVHVFYDDKNNESLTIANKALVLNGHGMEPGMYLKMEETRGVTYTPVDDVQFLGNLFLQPVSSYVTNTAGGVIFAYFIDSLKSENIFNPRFINHYAHEMWHPAQSYHVRIMSSGWIDIDFTSEE